jgi:hypothetical protein
VTEPQQQVPVLTTQIQCMKVETPERDFAAVMMATVLSSHLYHLTRSEAITFGSELMKLGRSMKREPKTSGLHVVGGEGLAVPGA